MYNTKFITFYVFHLELHMHVKILLLLCQPLVMDMLLNKGLQNGTIYQVLDESTKLDLCPCDEKNVDSKTWSHGKPL